MQIGWLQWCAGELANQTAFLAALYGSIGWKRLRSPKRRMTTINLTSSQHHWRSAVLLNEVLRSSVEAGFKLHRFLGLMVGVQSH